MRFLNIAPFGPALFLPWMRLDRETAVCHPGNGSLPAPCLAGAGLPPPFLVFFFTSGRFSIFSFLFRTQARLSVFAGFLSRMMRAFGFATPM